jgi:hypothetical protein
MFQLVKIDGKHSGKVVGFGNIVKENNEIQAIYIVDLDPYNRGQGISAKNDEGETYISKLVCDESVLTPAEIDLVYDLVI